jgi:hypothetical protein
MRRKESKLKSLHLHARGLLLTAVLCFVVVAGAGLLALCSCAHTKEGLQREQRIYEGTSNAITVLQPVAQAAPAPINAILGSIFAGLSGLLAVWATHIQRSVKELQKPNGNGAAAAPPPATG